MQHIPDKEFDNLFRDKFKDAEIEPSANLWANIERELEPKRKRTFPIYWMAAATIAVAFTAILVFQEKKVIQLRAPEETAQVKPATIQDDTIATPDVEQITAPVQSMAAQKEVKAPKRSVTKNEAAPKNNVIENKSQNNQIAVQPPTSSERLPIKQQDPKPIDVLPVKVPQENQTVIAQVAPIEKIGVDGDTSNEATSVSERKGIRNVGDLVNYVVEKVDKRDKKLVRFNTDDDDNSSIVGINIGFLKFNKKNKDK